jgi:NADPH:quinone reductase-like Zn-dependent oxidoreductase
LLSQRGGGTFAEYVRLPGRNCFAKPKHFSFEQAAAFPLAYLTAWRMLMNQAKLKPGELVLIVGIGGGVASAALRIAAHLGATILVTSRSAEKLAKTVKLANATGIHVTDNGFAEAVRRATAKRGVDVVVDCVGGPLWIESLAALARGGRLVSCGATAGAQPQTNLLRIFWNHLTILGSSAGSRAEFRELLDFFDTTRTEPIIDSVFPLEQAADALRHLEDCRQFGKIVLKIADE